MSIFHCFLLIVLSTASSLASNCRQSTYISTQDVKDAWRASFFAYKPEAIKGKTIPDTNFKIVDTGESDIVAGRTPVKVIVAEDRDTTLIAYRGTTTSSQLFDQLKASFQNLGGHKINIDGSQATIVKYFWLGYSQLYNTIRPYLDRVGKKYIITGHSLGGAMASIMALMAIKDKTGVWDSRKSSLVTFGQPRTGDGIYATKHDELIKPFRKLRFTNRNDPVPQLPIPLVPHSVHHSREIWMAKQVKLWRPKVYWKVCDDGDAMWCGRQRALLPNVNDHMMDQYDKYILNLPSLYYDSRSRKHRSLKNALKATCRN